MKMKLMEWENIFANHHIFHKMLVSKVNKEYKQPKRKKKKIFQLKIAENLNTRFPKETYRWPACLVIQMSV